MEALAAILLLLYPPATVRWPSHGLPDKSLGRLRFGSRPTHSRHRLVSMDIFDAIGDAFKWEYNATEVSDIRDKFERDSREIRRRIEGIEDFEAFTLDAFRRRDSPRSDTVGLRPEDYVTPLDKWSGRDSEIMQYRSQTIAKRKEMAYSTVDLSYPFGLTLTKRGVLYVVDAIEVGTEARKTVSVNDVLVGIDYRSVVGIDLETVNGMVEAIPGQKSTLTFFRSSVGGYDLLTEKLLTSHWLDAKMDELKFFEGDLDMQRGNLRYLEKLERSILEYQIVVNGRSSPEAAFTKRRLATTLKALGRLKEAEAMSRESLLDYQSLFPISSISVCQAKTTLAVILIARGNLKGANKLLAGVLNTNVRVLGIAAKETQKNIVDLTFILTKLNQLDEAEALLSKVVRQLTPVVEPNDEQLLWIKDRRAGVLLRQGKMKDAKSLLQEAALGRMRSLGINDIATQTSFNRYASLLAKMGDNAGALSMYQQVLDARIAKFGHSHWRTLESKGKLASAYLVVNDFEQATPLFEEVLNVRNSSLGPEHPETLFTKGSLAKVLSVSGQREMAAKLHREVLDVRNRTLGSEHPDTLWSMTQLAQTARRMKKKKLAKELLEKVLVSKTSLYGSEHPDTLFCRSELAKTLAALGDLAGAESHQRELVDVWNKTRGPRHRLTLVARDNLARTIENSGNEKVAREIYIENNKIRLETLGPKHPETRRSQSKLTSLRRKRSKSQVKPKLLDTKELEVIGTEELKLNLVEPERRQLRG